MLTEGELLNLMADLESDRVERTESVKDLDKFCIAACAFANDLPHHRQSGFVLVGVDNRGRAVGLSVTDQHLLQLGEVRASGRVLPIPSVQVYKIRLSDGSGEVAVLEVSFLFPCRSKMSRSGIPSRFRSMAQNWQELRPPDQGYFSDE